jgi:PAS domain S-box-containing protein
MVSESVSTQIGSSHKAKSMREMRMAEKMILLGFGLAVMFWIIQSFMAAFAFHKGSFLSQILSVEPSKLWMYSLVLCILVIFGGYAQVIIRQRKRVEAALRDSETKYSTLVEQAKDGVVIVQDEVCKFANRAMAEICGYPAERLLSMPFSQLLAPESSEVVSRIRQASTAAGEPPVVHEARILCADGTTKQVEIIASVIHYDGRPAGMGIARDVTDRKRAEEMLRHKAEELKRSNEELEQFAYVASHDLQEPLRMVASYVRLLERRYKDRLDADASDFIGYAADGANRMHLLINDLLAYSRVGTRGNQFEAADSTAALVQALANLEASIEESAARITFDSLPTATADASQLVQVFQNLVGNALKFRSRKRPRVHISAEENEEGYVFSVQDNGIGIDPKYSDRIFVIFQQLHDKSEHPGTGIGLAICKKIVERHGGRIWVESEPGNGATFKFTLPNCRGDGP